jgi:hypothetical protein
VGESRGADKGTTRIKERNVGESRGADKGTTRIKERKRNHEGLSYERNNFR